MSLETLGEVQRETFALIAHTCRARRNAPNNPADLVVAIDDLVCSGDSSPDLSTLLGPYIGDRESLALLLGSTLAAAADFATELAQQSGMTGESFCQAIIQNTLKLETT